MAKLTVREMQVARLVAQGMANRDVAAALGISLRTAKNHLWSTYRKLGIENRVQLAHWVGRENQDERPGRGG